MKPTWYLVFVQSNLLSASHSLANKKENNNKNNQTKNQNDRKRKRQGKKKEDIAPKCWFPLLRHEYPSEKLQALLLLSPGSAFRNSQGTGARTTATGAVANTQLLVACSFENKPALFLVRQSQTEVATKALNSLEIPFWFRTEPGGFRPLPAVGCEEGQQKR